MLRLVELVLGPGAIQIGQDNALAELVPPGVGDMAILRVDTVAVRFDGRHKGSQYC